MFFFELMAMISINLGILNLLPMLPWDGGKATRARLNDPRGIAVDSDGNIYTGEVDTGPRVQKFTRYGSESCSGAGYEDIGAYERNR